MTLSRSLQLLLVLACAHPFTAGSQTRTIDSLLLVIEAHPADTVGINAWLQVGFEYSRSNPLKARTCFHQAIRLSRDLRTIFGLSAAYSQLTTLHQNGSGIDSALHYLSLLKKLSEDTPARREIRGNYHMTAGLFYKNKGQFERALPHMTEALDYIPMPKQATVYSGQLLNIGNTYQSLGRLDKAAEFHLKGLRAFEALNNKRGQSFCLQGLGNDFMRLKRFDDAEKYYLQSLTLKEELNDQRGIISAWNGLAVVYMESGRNADAEKLLTKAIARSKELKLTQDESRALFDLATLEKKTGDLVRARLVLGDALEIARQRRDTLFTAKIAAEIALLDASETAREQVRRTLEAKISIARSVGDRVSEADACRRLSEHYSASGNFTMAFPLLRRYQQLNDSIEGQRVVVQLKEMEVQYENEKKEKEIALLKKDRLLNAAIISQQKADQKVMAFVAISLLLVVLVLVNQYRLISRNRRLREIEAVRNTIARDLHDDIGSGLSSIHILSKMALTANGKTPQHLARITENAERIMESMGDIVWSINPENDSVEKMVARMKEFTAEILEPRNIAYSFETSHDIAQTRLDVVQRKNLFLIFKESINNIARHSEGEKVTIRLEQVGAKLRLTIKDDGKGFDLSSVKYGNGLVNMEDRARAINGTLTRVTAPSQGTEILAEINLP